MTGPRRIRGVLPLVPREVGHAPTAATHFPRWGHVHHEPIGLQEAGRRGHLFHREKGPKGFYAPRVTRGPAVLVEDVVSEIEGRLASGAKTLGLKLNTMQKAMREGRIRAPVKKNSLAMPR